VGEVDPRRGDRAVAVGRAVGELDDRKPETERVACRVADRLEHRVDGLGVGELGGDDEHVLERGLVARVRRCLLRGFDHLRRVGGERLQ
jgi:hypothetical protein